MNITTTKLYTPQELRRIWNAQQRQIAKECISRDERRKTTITDREFLIKLVQYGYKLRYKAVSLWIDDETDWSILDTGGKRIYNATVGDMFAAIRAIYGVEPENLGL